MTFFDKLFPIRSRNSKTENGIKIAVEPLRTSVFDISKEQIRVVLFRECDRRGRKLLFDSSAVEKLPLVSQCKKPCSDVTLLGEMIFGSVAMVFKGENTCKIHSLTSPKCVMFTNIVHAPGPCQHQLTSEPGMETSSGPCSGNSLNEYPDQSRTSSSDSKLYKNKETSECSTCTYPCLKSNSMCNKLPWNCGFKVIRSDCDKKFFCHESWDTDCIDKKMCYIGGNNDETSCTHASQTYICGEKDVIKCTEMSVETVHNKLKTLCKCDSVDTLNCFTSYYECYKDFSRCGNGVSSSLSSLRRRWIQSHSSSVEGVYSEEADLSKIKTRTKLGMGLVVNLANSLETELENFLFNHTIVIEGILNKLQSSVSMAYLKKENFVDHIYTAVTNCQQSMYELITGGKFTRPVWLTLTEVISDNSDSNFNENTNINFLGKVEECRGNQSLTSIQHKFLNNFCEVLVKFDTKDTNFFISTLLTAVLTHHLSWVTSIAEFDLSLPENKLQTAIKNLRSYNPIWAQLNDLNGILGSPLKCTKTVITGPKNYKNNIASILHVLTYFIRCYNVVENLYDFDFEEITRLDGNFKNETRENLKNLDNYDGKFSCLCTFISEVNKKTAISEATGADTPGVTCVQKPELHIFKGESISYGRKDRDILQKTGTDGMKRSKSCLSNLEEGVCMTAGDTLCQYVDEVVEYKNPNMSNVDNFLSLDDYDKLLQDIQVPRTDIDSHLTEQDFSDREGYDEVDSCIRSEMCSKDILHGTESKNKVKNDVLFVLGENENLINLNKIVKNVSLIDSAVNVENIDSDILSGCKKGGFPRSKSSDIAFSFRDEVSNTNCRTLKYFRNEIGGGMKNCGFSQKQNSNTDATHGCNQQLLSFLHELPMPKSNQNYSKRRLDISSVLGFVNDRYNSEQIIQGVLEEKPRWEKTLHSDLSLGIQNPVLDRNLTEALCIIGDMNSWEVSLCSSHSFALNKYNFSGIRIGMSQLVADMLESLLHIFKIKLPPDFCLKHIEKKLHEIYSKSKSVAELLNNTDICSIEYLTSRLDISVNDVPLLLSVASTHSPHISTKGKGLTPPSLEGNGFVYVI